MMTLDEWKDLATIIGVVIAGGTLIKATFEYRSQGIQKRVERFLEMRKRLKENVQFKEICSLLDHEHQDPKAVESLANVAFKEKRDFLGFFEEVAIMRNSRMIRREVAHYMFGYYAILCWKSDAFWRGVNRDSAYWAVFKDFALEMEEIETSEDFKKLGQGAVLPRRKYRF